MILKIFLCFIFISVAAARLRHPKASDIKYFLHTRFNQPDGQIIVQSPFSNLDFNYTSTTFIIIHGFGENGETPWVTTTKDLLLQREDANVIIMNWGKLSKQPFYKAAEKNCQFTGENLAELLQFLKRRNQFRAYSIHIIGFSLGAQVAGVAGYHYKNIDRITGLEPAEPAFIHKTNEQRLDKSDASFVDIIHTNSGLMMYGHLSFPEPIGHVDFYPNGGHDQRGCPSLENEVIHFFENKRIPGCSHRRAYDYFIKALRDNDFVGYKCEEYKYYQRGQCVYVKNTMGLETRRDIEGTFYMDTLRAEPFVAFQVKVIVIMKTGAKGELFLSTEFSEESDEYKIFDGKVGAGDEFTEMIVSPTSGLGSSHTQVLYKADGPKHPTVEILSIMSQTVETNEWVCLGKNIKLEDGEQRKLKKKVGIC